MTNLKRILMKNTLRDAGGRALKITRLPLYFHEHCDPCYAFAKSKTFKYVTKRSAEQSDYMSHLKSIATTNTGLLIVQCQETGAIYLYGKVDQECESEYDDRAEEFQSIFVDWNEKNEKHCLIRVAKCCDSFVESFLE